MNYIGIILLIIYTLLIILININICWTGDLQFKVKDTLKSILLKYNHKYFGKPLNKIICKENLETIAKILNENKITFWLSEGTALGARRQGNFIDHDDDVDLGIWYKDYNKFKQIIQSIIKEGFIIELYYHSFIRFGRNNESIDIDFTGENIDCVACKTKRANCKSCNELLKYLKNMSFIDFLGNKYLCPDIDYLEYLYGKNWNIPKKEKFNNI